VTDAEDVRARLKDGLAQVAARAYRAAAESPVAEPKGVRFQLERKPTLVLAGILVLVLVWVLMYRGSSGEPVPVVTVVHDGPGGDLGGSATVHVTGAVSNPGVVSLEAGARVADAIEAAGGLAEGADESAVNLARPVRDGEQVYVPLLGEEGTGKVNLNRASSAELEGLPGIGPVLADRIVSDRDRNGPFATLDDLARVPGVGEAVVADIGALATV